MEYTEYGMNKNTENIILGDHKISIEDDEIIKNTIALLAIDTYTQIVHRNIIQKKLIKKEQQNRYDINISTNNIKYNKETKKHECTLKNGNIVTFDLISETLEKPSKKVIKELESNERKKKCHLMSVYVALQHEDSIVHTGTIIIGSNKILHSVVEIKTKKGKEFILDWTKNIVMDKDEYIKLFSFNILESIKSEDILNDSKFIKGTEILSLKYYLTFRDEIIKDLNRNSFIFDKETNKVKKLNNK